MTFMGSFRPETYEHSMKTILIKTPPVSVNQRYTISRGRNILSNKYRSAKEAIEWEIKSQWDNETIKDEDICINVLLYLKDKRHDIDAFIKLLLDAMSKKVYQDDRQIHELHVFKMYDKKNPRVEISIV